MSKCHKEHCVLSATANERPPALHVVALAKNSRQVFQLVVATNAAQLADAAATFVMVRAKSNLEIHNGSLRRRPQAATRLREQLRQLGDVRRHAPHSKNVPILASGRR